MTDKEKEIVDELVEKMAKKLYQRDVEVIPINYPLTWEELQQSNRDGYRQQICQLLVLEKNLGILGEVISSEGMLGQPDSWKDVGFNAIPIAPYLKEAGK